MLVPSSRAPPLSAEERHLQEQSPGVEKLPAHSLLGGDCAGQTEERPRVPPAAQGCPLQPSGLPEQVVPGREAAAFPLGSTGPEAAPSAGMESVPTGQSQLVKLT